MRRLVGCVALVGALVGCDGGGSQGEVGVVTFGINGANAEFRLKLFAPRSKAVDGSLTGKIAFDSGCLTQEATTYRIDHLPTGSGYAVAFEVFDLGSQCASTSRTGLGFRGGIDVIKGEDPYYFIPLYSPDEVTQLPVDLNVSEGMAERVPSTDGTCPSETIKLDSSSDAELWCAPTCASDSDCTGLHPRATCDTTTEMCMLAEPFPLNLSQGRAWGAAATLTNGDIVFFGGVVGKGEGRFETTPQSLERFSARTGLFEAVSTPEGAPHLGADFGFAALGGDRFVTVGGVANLTIDWVRGNTLGRQMNSQSISSEVAVWDLQRGTTVLGKLGYPVVAPSVIGLGEQRFLVVGGLVPPEGKADLPQSSRKVTVCSIAGDTVTCGGSASMNEPREAPALRCTDDTSCGKVLVLGGNSGGGPLAELITIDGGVKVVPVDSDGELPKRVMRPVLCDWTLIGGSEDATAVTQMNLLTLAFEDEGSSGKVKLTATRPSNPNNIQPPFLPAVARPGDRSCVLAGGVTADKTASDKLLQWSSEKFTPLGGSLRRPRLGAAAAMVGSGPLARAIVIAGGLSLPSPSGSSTTSLEAVRGAEVWLPAH